MGGPGRSGVQRRHAAGEQDAIADRTRLNRFRPRYFTINGGEAAWSKDHPQTTVRARVGQRILLRHLTGAYFVNTVIFPGALRATAHMSDGEPLPAPVRLPQNRFVTTTAERYDLILWPSAVGTHTVTYQFRHWLTGALAGTATAHVIVS